MAIATRASWRRSPRKRSSLTRLFSPAGRTSQPKTSDGHVYGGRSRFLTEKVIKCFDEQTFQGTNVDVKIEAATADSGTIDVASRLKQMW